MKVSLVTAHFAPRFEGGTEFVARAQARELAKRGHEISIVSGTDAPDGGERQVETVDGLRVVFFRRTADEPYDLALDRPRLAALVAAEIEPADLVHVHHWWTLDGALVRNTARTKPVVVTLHDSFTTCPRFFRVPVNVERCPAPGDFEPCARCCSSDARGLDLLTLESGLRTRAEAFRAELAAAARVVFPSHAHADFLAPYLELDASKTAVVQHGLCGPATALAGASPYTGAGALRVLFLGHLGEVKGVLDLARALVGVAGAEPVELILLGEEVEPGIRGRIEEAARGVGERGPRLTFGGGYRPEELAQRVEALGGAHVVALPSRVRESYGLVVDEARALGLPVWVSDLGAPKERVGAGGRVLPARDPAAWRAAFQEVLGAPETLAAERRAQPPLLRTAADAALELEDLYRDVLDRG